MAILPSVDGAMGTRWPRFWAAPAPRAVLVQLTAGIAWLVLALPLLGTIAPDLPLLLHVAGAGVVAAALGRGLGLPLWWLPINAAFMPGLVAMYGLDLPPRWYLAGFAGLLLLYWGVARGRVPLYLSSREAVAALGGLIPRGASVADLGFGLGGMLAGLSRQRPDLSLYGVEAAPLPFLTGWLRFLSGRARCRLSWGSFWKVDLDSFDVVYAYLSPVPMARLWDKARTEMRPGTLLVSNSFPVPRVTPSAVVQLDDLHRSRLYLYRF